MNRRTKPNHSRIPGILLMLPGVGCLVASGFLFFRPPEFQATARIRLIRDEVAVTPGMTIGVAMNANQTDVELLQSQIVLRRVIDQLNLATNWSKGGNADETLRLLKRRLNAQSALGTPFINISVLDDNPEEAARIANAVGEAYIAHRREAAVELTESAVRSLSEVRSNVLQQIESSEADANTMKTNLHIELLAPEAQMKIPIYSAMREQMAELTNALEGVERKLTIASGFMERPPRVAEISERADAPRLPVKRSPILPAILAVVGLLIVLAGMFLAKQPFSNRSRTR